MPENSPGTPVPSPPLVFISYSRIDEKARDRLHLFLEPAVQSGIISVWDDKLLNAGDEWNVKIGEAISRATVAVLLVSTDYLASDWVSKQEAPRLLDLMKKGRLRIVPLLIKPCSWQQISWLRNIQLFPSDANPITIQPRTAQDRLFKQAAEQIVRLATEPPASPFSRPTRDKTGPSPEPSSDKNTSLTVDDLSDFALSSEAQQILKRAGALATLAARKPGEITTGEITTGEITTSCLLFGIAEGGRSRSKFHRTPHFLFGEMRRRGAQVYANAFMKKFGVPPLSPNNKAFDFDAFEQTKVITPNVLNVFRRASKISKATLDKPEYSSMENPGNEEVFPGHIGARHILAALLVVERTGAMKRLSKMVDVRQLRKKFLAFIQEFLPDDNYDAWGTILVPGEKVQKSKPIEGEAIEQEATAAADVDKDFRAPLAGFLTDYWDKEDLLDITPDVNALASLVAAWRVDPPLSIGLFGDWGSGKSHFMRQMKARVEKLSFNARNSKKLQNELGYYKNIVQIEFNAWHYVEGNLWASLVDHIFANLRLSDRENVTLVEARRDAYMEKLGVKKEIQAKVAERKEQLKATETEARTRADDARNKREDSSHELQRLRQEFESSVLNQNLPVTLTAEQKKLLKQIGVTDVSSISAAELHKKYQETKRLSGRILTQYRIFKNDPHRLRRLAVPLALIIIPPLIGIVLAMTFKNLNRVYPLLASALTFLVTFWAGAQPYWKKFQQGLVVLEEKNKEIDNERQRRITELENEVNVLTKQYLDAEREAASINREVKELETQIASTTASKLLAEFIEDRAAASDYRRHLGVLALIRRDFEKLAELFSEQRDEERKGNGAARDDKTINRIILYIDDLDRCPPERVVQVLQAIHLLLAFPLFVVVVGVDARWVTRSLQESYEWLRVEDVEEKGKTYSQKEDSKQDSGDVQGATPHDYLEKIFQIPFWLKPMEDKACKNLVDGLTRDSLAAEEQEDDGPISMNEGDPKAADSKTNGAEISGIETEDKVPRKGEAILSHDPDLPATLEASGVKPDLEETDDEVIDLAPQSLTLRVEEVDYMKELTPLIGRSPRAVKRFLNCYRLIKVGLRPSQLKKFIGDKGQSNDYKAVMILLGVITGAPLVSLYLTEELEKCSKGAKGMKLDNVLLKLETNPEVNHLPDWIRVRNFLKEHVKPENSQEVLSALITITPRVSRYSFRLARVEVPTAKNARPARKRSPAIQET